MTRRLLVLDVHGVVLNNPLAAFLAHLDTINRQPQSAVSCWAQLRRSFWEGEIDEDEMWSSLAPGADSSRLREELESRYAPGPYYHHLLESDHPCWLLTNHRKQWLEPRLERFGLRSRFERVLVSDEQQAAKPSSKAFAPVIEAARNNLVTFVDDSIGNVLAARRFGLDAVLADELVDWSSIAD